MRATAQRGCEMSITAAEPSAAGLALIGIGAASGLALFSAFGGALIGAGISIAIVHSQLSGWGSQARRFLVSVFGGSIITLAALETAEVYGYRFGVYAITFFAMIISFVAWKLFTVLHNRSTSIFNRAIDEALREKSAPPDQKYIDSGPAEQWLDKDR